MDVWWGFGTDVTEAGKYGEFQHAGVGSLQIMLHFVRCLVLFLSLCLVALVLTPYRDGLPYFFGHCLEHIRLY